jgi:protein gp37
MKIENPIKWTDETTNAVTGCDRVSAGCKNCYAEAGTRARVLRSQGIETWGPNGVRHPVNFEPVFRRLNKLCICDKCHTATSIESFENGCSRPDPNTGFCEGELRRIRLFADSNSDWLDEKWPVETLAKLLDAIRLAPNVDVILLTKRLENFIDRVSQSFPEVYKALGIFDQTTADFHEWAVDWLNGNPPKNLWLGVSVENQAMADKRIPLLLSIPAAVRFLSAEPLLEPVNFNPVDLYGFNGSTEKPRIDWIICGAESGQHRRDCGVEAIISVAQQCQAAGVPIFVKQDAALFSGAQGRIPDNIFNLKQFPNVTKDTRSWWAARQMLL